VLNTLCMGIDVLILNGVMDNETEMNKELIIYAGVVPQGGLMGYTFPG
jgi:hypothetical protein